MGPYRRGRTAADSTIKCRRLLPARNTGRQLAKLSWEFPTIGDTLFWGPSNEDPTF